MRSQISLTLANLNIPQRFIPLTRIRTASLVSGSEELAIRGPRALTLPWWGPAQPECLLSHKNKKYALGFDSRLSSHKSTPILAARKGLFLDKQAKVRPIVVDLAAWGRRSTLGWVKWATWLSVGLAWARVMNWAVPGTHLRVSRWVNASTITDTRPSTCSLTTVRALESQVLLGLVLIGGLG